MGLLDSMWTFLLRNRGRSGLRLLHSLSNRRTPTEKNVLHCDATQPPMVLSPALSDPVPGYPIRRCHDQPRSQGLRLWDQNGFNPNADSGSAPQTEENWKRVHRIDHGDRTAKLGDVTRAVELVATRGVAVGLGQVADGTKRWQRDGHGARLG
ncbi:hypothetical protein GOBAR_DD36539 [Gossypium barbadense]|nr:hypothetical protein GOBAR_DD36539 [Gossypium barbadense]